MNLNQMFFTLLLAAHFNISTSFRPENMTDEQRAKYLRQNSRQAIFKRSLEMLMQSLRPLATDEERICTKIVFLGLFLSF